MRKTTLFAAFVGVSLAAVGCVVHEREVVAERPAAPACHGAFWVQDGNHGHWDCPAEEHVEVKVVP
jgi:hypothetical protein